MTDLSALSREVCDALRAAPTLYALAGVWQARRADMRTVIAANPIMQTGFSNVSKDRAAELTGETQPQGMPWEEKAA